MYYVFVSEYELLLAEPNSQVVDAESAIPGQLLQTASKFNNEATPTNNDVVGADFISVPFLNDKDEVIVINIQYYYSEHLKVHSKLQHCYQLSA